MASGVGVADACKEAFDKIKTKKEFRFVIFKIKDEKRIEVESTGNRKATYDQFLRQLKVVNGTEKECRYGLFDFEYAYQRQGTLEGKKQRLLLISWCPDDASVKKKMLYSSSFYALKNSLVGVSKFIQATDDSEADCVIIEENLRTSDRM